ncbi:hypothetical protein [Frondihabitans australicus]|uniref:Uncharacterized protein n=1 Tax=Frondihabitans australicus TaxID=386892 RepID=A0A495IGJ9_9MICO|nr:hypothetical protein [Frondihabitans australicus]RKR74206.1 hypothetical protein C8E83_1314 [Frondihabitans australicus]
MTDGDWEAQGARPRVDASGAPATRRAAPPALRALSALGVALVVIGVGVLVLPAMGTHVYQAQGVSRLTLSPVAVIASWIVAATGAVVLTVRVATGVLLRAIQGES